MGIFDGMGFLLDDLLHGINDGQVDSRGTAFDAKEVDTAAVNAQQRGTAAYPVFLAGTFDDKPFRYQRVHNGGNSGGSQSLSSRLC